MSSIEAEIAALDRLSSSDLRARWRQLTQSPVPRVSPKLLRLALAWEMQAQRLGSHTRETTRRLDQLARGSTRTDAARPGMRLVREWQGRTHVVTIGDDRSIVHEGRSYGSLSEVARAITGTRWSGPAFFGLKKRVSREAGALRNLHPQVERGGAGAKLQLARCAAGSLLGLCPQPGERGLAGIAGTV